MSVFERQLKRSAIEHKNAGRSTFKKAGRLFKNEEWIAGVVC
jgi:hypothetical protein